MLKYITFILFILLIVSCKKDVTNDKNENININTNSLIKYAKGFDIQINKNYTKLIIKSPYPNAKYEQEFILITKDKSLDYHLVTGKKLIVPLKNIVATSTTHVPMIELLNEEKSIIGFPNTKYVTSKKTVDLIKKKLIIDVGNEQEFNTEIILALQPDAMIGFTMGNTTNAYRTIEKNGIPIIFNSDWLEETPLGRAEWIKFFGVLFNKYKKADSIFKNIETNYLEAKKIASKAKNTPTIMTGMLFKDKWNLPAGNSFMVQFYKDANINYLWKDSKGQGSLVLSYESVLNKARKANFWIGSGYFTKFEEMANSNVHYKEFDAFQNKKTYTFSKKRGENGGVIYFELAPVQPDIVLKDLIKITHPELLPNYKPFFIQKLD